MSVFSVAVTTPVGRLGDEGGSGGGGSSVTGCTSGTAVGGGGCTSGGGAGGVASRLQARDKIVRLKTLNVMRDRRFIHALHDERITVVSIGELYRRYNHKNFHEGFLCTYLLPTMMAFRLPGY
jgi:hypothetical protein